MMIEELKLILDTIGDLSDIALWVIGAFILFKLVTYMATTGAIVYVIKLIVSKGHDILTRERKVKYYLSDFCIGDGSEIIDALKRCRSSSLNYLHNDDISWIVKTLDKAIKDRNKK